VPSFVVARQEVNRYGGQLTYISELMILHSAAGYYIGRLCEEAGFQEPYSRDSQEYYRTQQEAQLALDNESYTPKLNP
jgi:hypothetical protein